MDENHSENSSSSLNTDDNASINAVNSENADSKNLQLMLDGPNTGKEGLNFEVNLQPEKIVEVFRLPDGTQSYRVRWKDTWIHEQLIVSYQHLVDQFWQEHAKETEEADTKKVDFSLTSVHNDQLVKTETKVILVEPVDDDNEDKIEDDKDVELNFDEATEEIAEDKNDVAAKPAGGNNVHSLKRKANSGNSKKSAKKGRGRPRKASETRKVIKQPAEDEKENQMKKTAGETENVVDENKTGQETDTSSQAQESNSNEKKDKYQYPDDKGPCSCDICGKVISNKYGLREHQTVVHFKNGRFECDICGKRVTNKRALNLHKTSHSNERKFVCDQCGSSHKTKGNLNYHIKTMHTLIKNFRCDICFKTFKVQAELKDHCFSMHSNAGVITCIVCKKKLTTSLSIYTHSVMHSGAREYECDICGYAFKTLTGLKEHKITHSENKPVRQCPYCERKFFSRSQYNAHVMRHTADGSLITYKCPMCEVKFQHKSSYNRHVIRHQPGGDLEFPKENPYLLLDEGDLPEGVCHKCRKYYSSKSGFYLHLKKCRDGIVQQFQCPVCERGCSNRSSLKRHIQRRHKGMEFEGQTVQGQEIIQKNDLDTVDNVQQGAVITQEDGISYQGTYFDHGYGNQITTVDVSQLPAVDVQLLIDTAASQGDAQTAHILSNVGQLGEDSAQNLHILSGAEAAQFAAQLTQHGVIVRSSDVTHDQSQESHQQLIVSSAQIDARTGQIIVNGDGQAQIINAEALAGASLNPENSTILQTANGDSILRDEDVLQFNNRTAVIQIQHPGDGMSNQQVLRISDQQLQENSVARLHSQMSDEAASELQQMGDDRVNELSSSQSMNEMETENITDQQFIQEEQIVSNLSDNDVEHAYDSMEMLK